MIVREIASKSVLTKSKLPEADYCINPYVGCTHGCVYCYARFMRRFTNHHEPWGEFVDVKANAGEVLRKELARVRRPGLALLGSVTDAYQPAERKYQITRALLAALVGTPFSVSTLTKSDLVLRDLDLWKQVKDGKVGLTITTLDEDARKRLEPGASSIARRLEALRVLHENGIANYVFIGPILPHFTDLRAIFEAVRGIVDSVWAEALNIRCGNWAMIEHTLQEHYPDLVDGYKATAQDGGYWEDTGKELSHLSAEFGIPLVGFFRH
jgi:DNA repair photolyase